jgi:ribonuclease HII
MSRPGPSKAAPSRSGQRPGSKREKGFWESGSRLVAGVDEVGRGAWAGPLSVGVAVLRAPLGRAPRGLRDSKQIVESERERLFDKVASWCTAWAVGHVGPGECDSLGMTAGLRLASRRAFAQLPTDLLPDAVVLDGNFDFVSAKNDDRSEVALPSSWDPIVHTVVRADASCVSVAAASVLAKVTRDRLMRESAECYPPFDFERNKGYPSPSHQRALRGYGLSAIHRCSWVYVEKLPWADPRSSLLRGGLLCEPEDSLTDDVVEDFVGAAGYAHPGHPEDELGPCEGAPLS